MSLDARDESRIPSIQLEERGPLAVLLINRPRQRNSLSAAMLKELEQAFSLLSTRDRIKAIILTGTGDAFASGADIRELSALTPASALEFARRGQHLFQRIADARQLTIAAVNGFCMGGGLDLALSCDVRVASPEAVFAHPGARLGIITGWGGTQRLPALIGAARALELFTTARRLTAREALDIGLISRIDTDALACALELASLRV